MNNYLVTIYWKKRPLGRYFLKAQNESQAIYKAVEKGCIDKNEFYDHTKSKAVLIDLMTRPSGLE
ncbi:MAG: hypothetical protein ACPGUE_11185 [Marinomonas sp.]